MHKKSFPPHGVRKVCVIVWHIFKYVTTERLRCWRSAFRLIRQAIYQPLMHFFFLVSLPEQNNVTLHFKTPEHTTLKQTRSSKLQKQKQKTETETYNCSIIWKVTICHRNALFRLRRINKDCKNDQTKPPLTAWYVIFRSYPFLFPTDASIIYFIFLSSTWSAHWSEKIQTKILL